MKNFSRFLGFFTVTAILALMFFFLILPVSSIVIKAFFHEGKFTLEFFRLLFANELLRTSLINSLEIALAVTIATTFVSLPISIINARYDYVGKTILSGLLLVPMILPPFVGAIGFHRFFAQHGAVNLLLQKWNWITEPIEWLSDDNKFWVVVILATLNLYPIMYLNLSAALANLDPSLEEMASTLGIKKWRQLKDIVWPLAKPGYFAGAIIVFIWSFTDLGTPLLIGYLDVVPVKIFNFVTEINDNPIGFALVFIVILITVVLFLVSKRVVSSKKFEMMAKGHVTSGVKKVNWYGYPLIYGILLGVIFLALIPHISVIVTSISSKWFMTPLPEEYTLAYYGRIFHQDLPLIGIKNSFMLASASTFFDIVLGVLVAYVVIRKLIPFAFVLDIIVMIPLALPGIVLAFGYVVTFTDTFLDPMKNPIPLLIIAYGIRRLPYMVRSATAGLQQTSASLEEASSTFGASRFHTLRKITVPLLTANIVAGSLLCFAYAMLDVSDSMILAMKDQYYPMTKVIYSLYLEHGSGEFVASALGVVAMFILAGCIMGASVVLGKKMGELFRS